MSSKDISSQFDERGRYILRSYDQMQPFSSFLPGIAGLYGIPMWVFYTNRGQAVSSFGIESKDRPILEFQPANKSYQLTGTLGFRTFVKSPDFLFEPFSVHGKRHVSRDMFLGMNEVAIRETDFDLQLETEVLYFNLPNEEHAGLVRQVSFRNLGTKEFSFEVLDGLPALIPYGADNGVLKHISRTIEAWMEVEFSDPHMPFYRLRASTEDSSEVRKFEAGNFALSVSKNRLLHAVVDPAVVFGTDTSFSHSHGFTENGLAWLETTNQITEGRTPCAFFGESVSLAQGESHIITSVFGFARNKTAVQKLADNLLTPHYVETKYTQAQLLSAELARPIETRSGNPVFDAYCRQTFLDNIVRGGWPEVVGDRHIYHVYSRKHGDPERDYNHFFLAAENFSQGNGNFRDVNQNRRNDVVFEPRVADFNIRFFMSLIQTDGYNPLVVEGSKFSLPQDKHSSVFQHVRNPEPLKTLLEEPFSPGELLTTAAECGLRVSIQEFVNNVLGDAEQLIQADFGEGYWVDHWTYNLDLVDTYLSIYPDKKNELLFDAEPLPFFDSPAVVNPRSLKYVLANGEPHQFNAIEEDDDKLAMIASRSNTPNWVRSEYGKGDVFRLPLFSKLVMVALMKFSSRDPLGMGIEMEAGRPSWYDALNGLPGLFGSSMPESFELLRLLDFLTDTLQAEPRSITLPVEANGLLEELLNHLTLPHGSFEYWDAVTAAREQYRETTRFGVDGSEKTLSADLLISSLQRLRESVRKGIDDAVQPGSGITPTYFSFQVADYKLTGQVDHLGRPVIKPLRFTCTVLPDFLEGPVHQMKVTSDREDLNHLYDKVRDSDLFDPQLQMYRLNTSLLGQPYSIGRARAFTRGWLENESIWLHMSYKYLLEVLRAGLYDEFYDDLQTCVPAFMDANVYGRSPLENSSFIVSSVHPDNTYHGRGFVARLSGATAEFLSLWFIMMTGGKPFACDTYGNLTLELRPKLPGWLFPQNGILEFCFLGHTQVQIHNPSRQNTWGLTPVRYQIQLHDQVIAMQGEQIAEPTASQIRAGKATKIEVYLESIREK